MGAVIGPIGGCCLIYAAFQFSAWLGVGLVLVLLASAFSS